MLNNIATLLNQSPAAAPGPRKSALGKDDFLKLMIQQLKYQDPLNPLDSSQYSAQLAQFSSLEQLQNINTTLTQSMNANFALTQSVNNTMTATLIGKDARLSSNKITYNGENNGQGNAKMGYTLPALASDVTVKIYNSDGVLVKTLNNLEKDAGEHKLSWDFTDNEGNKVKKGDYTFKVEASDMSGEDMTIDSFGYGTIDAVRFTENGTMLVINGIEYNLSDISEILNSSVPSSAFKIKELNNNG